MPDASSDPWSAQLAPGVADYCCGHFALGRELERLHAVREAVAIEAIVFYGASVGSA